jgi:hypothetical protein
MPDMLIIADHGGAWTLALRKGVVVRLSDRARTGRIRLALSCHCGGPDDNPADLARMRDTYAREDRMNA